MKDEVLVIIMENRLNVTQQELSKQISEYFEKERKKERVTVLQGFLIALERSDEVFEIIMNENPEEQLMQRLGLSKIRANALLALPIGKFIELDRQKIEDEINKLIDWIIDYDER